MNLLTPTESHSNLNTLPEKAIKELGRSISQGAGDCTNKGESLFLCPKSIMVGVLGSIRACWLLDPVDQPRTSAALSLVASGGSLKTIVKELAMSLHCYSQNSAHLNPQSLNTRLKSLFTLLDANKRTIANHLTFEQAKAISTRINHSVIKFEKMEAIQ